MKVTVISPPENLSIANKSTDKIFLAGSIELGLAQRWQDTVIEKYQEYASNKTYWNSETIIFNPRRTQWDSSWKQEIEHAEFYHQVTWELKAMEMANKIIMYFDPTTKSPVSLLELGLNAKADYHKMYVVCPKGFWRKGNVDIVCERYGIKQYDSIDEVLKTWMGNDYPSTSGVSGWAGSTGTSGVYSTSGYAST